MFGLSACNNGDDSLLTNSAPETAKLYRVERKIFRLPAARTKTLVTLTYDDGDDSQLAHAIPQLDAHGLHGTFFLNSVGNTFKAAKWRAAARSGHELGNHTVFHPCPRSFGGDNGFANEDYTLATYASDVIAQDGVLDVVDGRGSAPRPFAYPCGQYTVGEDKVSILPFIERVSCINFARTATVYGAEHILPDTTYSPTLIPSFVMPTGTTLAELTGRLEEARRIGGAQVFTFHILGGPYGSTSIEVHNQFLDYLVANRDRFEVVPFGILAESGALTVDFSETIDSYVREDGP